MAVIKGNLVSKFYDRKIEVRVFLNPEESTKADNQGKIQPRLLDNTTKTNNGNYIGKAVICQDGSHIVFEISTHQGLCGMKPMVKTQHEIIYDDLYSTTTKRYGQVAPWIRRYSSENRTIKVSDFGAYEKQEGFQRSNVLISAIEVISFTRDGVNYPTSGIEANVVPGSLDKGAASGDTFGTISNVKLGDELGAMQMQFFVLKDAAAVENFAEALRGVTADEDW